MTWCRIALSLLGLVGGFEDDVLRAFERAHDVAQESHKAAVLLSSRGEPGAEQLWSNALDGYHAALKALLKERKTSGQPRSSLKAFKLEALGLVTPMHYGVARLLQERSRLPESAHHYRKALAVEARERYGIIQQQAASQYAKLIGLSILPHDLGAGIKVLSTFLKERCGNDGHKPQTTIFAHAYTQESFGITSYHFVDVSDCYISFGHPRRTDW